MDYFSLEILDFFSKKNKRTLRLHEQGNPADVVFSILPSKKFPNKITTKAGLEKLKERDIPASKVASEAGPNVANAKQIQGKEGTSPIWAWKVNQDSSGEQQPQQQAPAQEVQAEQPPQDPAELQAAAAQLEAELAANPIDPRNIDKLTQTMANIISPTSLRKFLGLTSELTKSARAILNTIASQSSCGTLSQFLNKGCTDPKGPELFIKNLTKALFFDPLGTNQRSLTERLTTASTIAKGEDGTLNFDAELPPEQRNEIVQNILGKLLELASKDELSDSDVAFIKNRIKYFGNLNKLGFYSVDGTVVIGFSNKGVANIISTILLDRFNKISNNSIKDYDREVLEDDSYSSILGNLIEDLTSVRIRSKRLITLKDECKDSNAELCSNLEKEIQESDKQNAELFLRLSDACKKLIEFGGELKDFIGDPELIKQIISIQNQLEELTKTKISSEDLTPEQLQQNISKVVDAAKKVGLFTTAMVELQELVTLSDWSVVTGWKRGANRKGDLGLFYFNENKARVAQEQAGESYTTYELTYNEKGEVDKTSESYKELASIFERDEEDKELELLLKVMKEKKLTKVHAIRPSLKTQISERGTTTLATTSAKNSDSIYEALETGNLEQYVNNFNIENKDLGRLTLREATELRDTVFNRAKAAGFGSDQEVTEALKRARQWNKPFAAISKMNMSQVTQTLNGASVKTQPLATSLSLLDDLTKTFQIEIEADEQKAQLKQLIDEGKGLGKEDAKELVSLVKGAIEESKNISSGKVRDKNNIQNSEAAIREYIMKSVALLQNAKRKKLLNSEDPETARKERQALAVELLTRGCSSKNDTAIIKTDFRERSSSILQHNKIISEHIMDMLDPSRGFEAVVMRSGFKLQDPITGASITINPTFAGKTGIGGSFLIKVNKQSAKRGSIGTARQLRPKSQGVQPSRNL